MAQNTIAKLSLVCIVMFTVALALAFPASAHACLICYSVSGPAYCTYAFNGGEICVVGQPAPNQCQTYFNCRCNPFTQNCTACPPTGCEAKASPTDRLRENLGGARAQLQNCAYDASTPTPEAKVQEFLAMAESGKFSGPKVKIYLAHDGAIHHALTNSIPVSHWQKWSVGFETDKKGAKHTKFWIRTQSGHDLDITLM